MAQSFVQVPPDGAGKEVDTFITDSAAHHRQVIAIADAAVDANTIPVSTRLRLPVESEVQADFDTGAGTENISLVGIALPANGGAVVGGTATNPIIVTATGTVPLPTGAATLAEQQVQTSTLADIRTSVQILDDWDESDRAKVNPIVGQVGVVGGSGTVTASTQRVVLATDVALPAGANLLGSVVGSVADDSPTPGNPITVGGLAKTPDGTDPGNVSAEDDVARFITDLNRRQYVNTLHPNFKHKHLDGSSAYTDETIAASPGAGFQLVITNIIGSTGAATALNFFLEEGSTKIFGPIYLEAVAGRGFASGPINLPVTASTAVTLTSSAAIAQSFDIDYYIQKV